MKTEYEIHKITRTQSRQKMHTGELIVSFNCITDSRDTAVYSMTMLKLY